MRNSKSDALKVGVGHHGHNYLFHAACKLVVNLCNGKRKHFFNGFIEFFAIFESQALHDSSVVHVNVVHIVAVVVACHRIYVEIMNLSAHDNRLCLVFLNKQIFLLHLLCLLEAQLLSERVHFVLQIVAQLLNVTI